MTPPEKQEPITLYTETHRAMARVALNSVSEPGTDSGIGREELPVTLPPEISERLRNIIPTLIQDPRYDAIAKKYMRDLIDTDPVLH